MMWGRTVKVFFLIAILSVFAADVTVGCGQGYVYGPVSQKLSSGVNENAAERQIVINNSPFDVPVSFYDRVQVGDWVRFNGREWTIVKRANSPTPASPPP